eukprot:854121-Prymnesium_polylepis.1
MKIHLMTEQAESARNNWDRLADAEQLQKVIDFYKEEEKGELPPGAHRALPEPILVKKSAGEISVTEIS